MITLHLDELLCERKKRDNENSRGLFFNYYQRDEEQGTVDEINGSNGHRWENASSLARDGKPSERRAHLRGASFPQIEVYLAWVYGSLWIHLSSNRRRNRSDVVPCDSEFWNGSKRPLNSLRTRGHGQGEGGRGGGGERERGR